MPDVKNNNLHPELSATLDAFGADPARWPAERRARLLSYVKSAPSTVELMREAAALDELVALAAADSPETAPLPLTQRILAEARRADADAGIVESRGHGAAAERAALEQLCEPAPDSPQPVWTRKSGWLAAGMMAASLVAGIYLGGGEYLDTSIGQVASLALSGGEIETATSLLPPIYPDDPLGDEFL